jgi:tRNA(fMet)-specific endonuclease VapC
VILDTGVIAGGDRGRLEWSQVIGEEDDAAIAAVTAAELLQRFELGEGRVRDRRRVFVEGVLSDIPIESYDLSVARHHARLLAHCRVSGEPRGAHDLMIAATAVATGRTVVTTDEKARFEGLPGVRARVLPR